MRRYAEKSAAEIIPMGAKPKNNGLTEPLKKWRKPDDISEVRMRQYRACRAAEQVMYDPNSSRQEVLNAVYAVTQAVNTYMRVIEVDDLYEKVEELEEMMEQQRNNRNGLRRVAP